MQKQDGVFRALDARVQEEVFDIKSWREGLEEGFFGMAKRKKRREDLTAGWERGATRVLEEKERSFVAAGKEREWEIERA